MAFNIETSICKTPHNFISNIHAAQWVDRMHRWNADWLDNPKRLCTFNRSTHPPGMAFLRTVWVQPNGLHTSVKSFHSWLHKRGVVFFAAWECGPEKQTDEHVFQRPIHRPPHRLHGLMVLDN